MNRDSLGTYMIAQKGGPYVKIGAAKSAKKRLRELQMASPLELYIQMWVPHFDMEKQLHKQFSVWRVRGEWFLNCEEVYQFAIEGDRIKGY